MEKSKKYKIAVRSITDRSDYKLSVRFNSYVDGGVEFDIEDSDDTKVNFYLPNADNTRPYINRILAPSILGLLSRQDCPITPAEIADIRAALYNAVTYAKNLKGKMVENYSALEYHSVVRISTKYVPRLNKVTSHFTKKPRNKYILLKNKNTMKDKHVL